MPESYSAALSSIAAQLPDLHRSLNATESARARRLVQYADGARLRGVDELLRHLRLVERSLAENGHADDLGFLITRAIVDFEICVEAALSGMVCLAHEAMRDAMEIEFLLREFAAEPGQLDRWLHANQDEVKTVFSPNRLRQRHAARHGVDVTDLAEHSDYKGHSIALHVTPSRHPMLKKGLVDESDLAFGSDMAFWELFQHARRVVFTLHELLQQPRFANVSNPDPQKSLPLVADAYERTQQMQTIFLALIGALPEEGNGANDA